MHYVFAFFVALLIAHTSVADNSLKLWKATKTGDFKQCKSAIKKNANVDFVGPDGTTPLWLAARDGYGEIVSLLLEHRAKVLLEPSTIAQEERSPLLISGMPISPRLWKRRAESRNAEERSLFVESPRKRKFKKRIHVGAGRKIEVSALDMSRIYENQKENNRKLGFPIHIAIHEGHAEVVRILLKNGTAQQIKALDENKNTPVHLVSSTDDLDLFDAVVTPFEAKNKKYFRAHLITAVNSFNHEGFLPLHIAIETGGRTMIAKIQALLNGGAFPNGYSIDREKSMRPVELACQGRKRALATGDTDESHRYSHAIILLLLAGGEPQSKYCIGQTKLFMALQNRFKSYVFDQLAKKSPDKKDRDPLDVLYDQLLPRDSMREIESDDAEHSSSHYETDDLLHGSEIALY